MISDIDKWRKACSITAAALQHGISMVKKGNSLLTVAEEVDKRIFELGGKPSFPCQISLDDVAAHYCPESDDKTVFEAQVVKVDVGASFDGFLGDAAATVDLSGRYSDLVKASKEALYEAIKVCKPGVALFEVGRTIQGVISNYGFSPIVNLSGHGLARFQVHSEPTVPNYDNSDRTKLYDGQIIALEPFATNGSGSIYESSNPSVFMEIARKPIRSLIARSVYEEIRGYEGLPFASRWLSNRFTPFKVNFALKELVAAGIVRSFPPLVEKAHGIVSQFEHTIMVGDEPEILTRLA